MWSACLCVFVCDHIFGTIRPMLSITVSRRIDTLCTSGFMDDVIFAHKPRLLDVTAQLKRSAHAALGSVTNCAQ